MDFSNGLGANLTEESFPQSRLITPSEFYTHYFLGILMAIFTIMGVLGNAAVFTLFHKHSCLRSRTTVLLRSLAVSDGTLALIGGTMFTVNCFGHRWMFFRQGCVLHAFVMYWCGVTSIAHLCAIAVERVITITNPAWSMANRGRISGYTVAMVAFCWLYGLFWAILPFFGFQEYAVEGYVSCSINWFHRTFHHIIYQVIIFASAFLLPLLIICTSNGIILYVVHKSFFTRYGGNHSSSVAENRQAEWKITRSLLASMALYLLAWSPYAAVAMWASFGDAHSIPYLIFDCLGFFAKISFVFNPFVYVGTNTLYRQKLAQMRGSPKSETSHSCPIDVTLATRHTPRDDCNPRISLKPHGNDGSEKLISSEDHSTEYGSLPEKEAVQKFSAHNLERQDSRAASIDGDIGVISSNNDSTIYATDQPKEEIKDRDVSATL